MSTDNAVDRRAFLRGLGRLALAGLLTGGIGALIARPGEQCHNSGPCRGCPALPDCRLPEARAAREANR